MLAKELAELLMKNPENEVRVVFSQQEPDDEYQIEEPVVLDSLLSFTYLSGENHVAEYFVQEDFRAAEEITRPRRLVKKMVQVWVEKEVWE